MSFLCQARYRVLGRHKETSCSLLCPGRFQATGKSSTMKLANQLSAQAARNTCEHGGEQAGAAQAWNS